MDILITGGGGFAGRYLADFFVQKNYGVSATYRRNVPSNSVNGVRYIKQELSEEIEIDGHFDAIIHTAVSHSGKILPITDYIRDNVDSARRIVEFARKKKINTIFYFSTRSVYGQVRTDEVFEDTDIINPDKYGATKYLAEQVFQEADDINTLGIRVPGIIGPGAHDIWLVDVVNRINNGEDVVITDYDTKNLVYIKDIAAFAEKMITFSNDGNVYDYKVINLCCRETINNLEMASIIKERLKSPSNITRRSDTTGLFKLNTYRAEKMGFVSSSPRTIVNEYLDWFCSNDRNSL